MHVVLDRKNTNFLTFYQKNDGEVFNPVSTVYSETFSDALRAAMIMRMAGHLPVVFSDQIRKDLKND